MEVTSVAPFHDYWDKVRGRTVRVVDRIPADRVEWTWQAGKFTLGDLVRHLGAIERYMYAENAIKHGLARRGGQGRIWISARAEGPVLLLTLRDNGPGLREDASPGIGLANTRRRLEALYPGAHSLTLAPAPEGGCEVRLRIPLDSADAATGPTPISIRRAS